MYRSGDIVRLRIDGRFDYIGRKDSQIKLNGQRVELSEINGAIESSAQNVQAASIHVKDEDGSMNIYSFYRRLGCDIMHRIGGNNEDYTPFYL